MNSFGKSDLSQAVRAAADQLLRRDFRLDTLTQMSSFGEQDTLFANLGDRLVAGIVFDRANTRVLAPGLLHFWP